jgi:hypothetical protein
MREIIIPPEKKEKIFTLLAQNKTKADISKEVGICRKKVLQIARTKETSQDFFNPRQYKNWLV